MGFDSTQKGVARGMAAAVVFAVGVFAVAYVVQWPNFPGQTPLKLRLKLAAWAALAPAAALIFPARLLPLVAAVAALFVVGRIAFFRGYAAGAPSRAAGFGLTFHPTVALLVLVVAVAVLQGDP